MASGPEHWNKAQELLACAENADNDASREDVSLLLKFADVHFNAARTAATAAPSEASRYGAEFDRLADRWRVLEDQHDQIHPNRSDCGGVGGCSLMFAAHDLTTQMEDQMEDWRQALAISEGIRHCGCDHHGDHAGCDADCECA